MKKVYKLIDLDCANCAAKIEESVSKLAGVEKASVSFLTQKMTIVAAEDAHAKILDEAIKIVKKFEPDVEVVAK